MDGMMDCDPAVLNLPITDPLCVKAAECCTAFYAGENASQAATPWAGQFDYGHWTTYYWVIIVGLLMLWHVWNTIQERKSFSTSETHGTSKPNLKDKLTAYIRWVSYRRIDKKGYYWPISMPSTGLLVFLVVTIVFLTALTFAKRPYYRNQFGFGSPPIAIRTGLMAFACMPILVALAGKANIITLLTGISHEKLNVVHQWVAWMCFGLSWIHTIPFFIASLKDPGNGGYARVVSEFYRSGAISETEYSGVPPMAMLVGLCVFSIPQIRRRLYETFYFAHIAMAIVYLGLLFWHAGNAEDSWAYLWATVAVWSASWLVRFFHYMRSTNIHSEWFTGAEARLTLMQVPLVRMEVARPLNFNFKPGQHCFMRFMSLSFLDSHPFTIASAPGASTVMAIEEGKGKDTLLFLAKTHDGFTRDLAEFCKSNGGEVSTEVILDGPYGGMGNFAIERHYDSVLLIAGGSGISSALSWLEHTACISSGSKLKTVTLIWAVRDAASFGWVSQELESISSMEGGPLIQLKFYVTGSPTEVETRKTTQTDDKDNAATKASQLSPNVARMQEVGQSFSGRPDLQSVINESLAIGQRLGVFVCGPHGMSYDVANICAAAQRKVLTGNAVEVALHVESFGW